MKGYKAFGKGLICRGKQYAENTVFEEDSAEICKRGMHFCENPLDCLDHYPLVDDNGEMVEIAEVEALDDAETDDKKKFCTKKLKIGAKLSLPKFIKASFDFLYEKTHNGGKKSSGRFAQMASAGGFAKMANAGDYTVICCAGHGSIAKGKKGSWITLAEWEWSDEEGASIPVCVKTEQIDGVRIKEDTFYNLENGEFVEVY